MILINCSVLILALACTVESGKLILTKILLTSKFQSQPYNQILPLIVPNPNQAMRHEQWAAGLKDRVDFILADMKNPMSLYPEVSSREMSTKF